MCVCVYIYIYIYLYLYLSLSLSISIYIYIYIYIYPEVLKSPTLRTELLLFDADTAPRRLRTANLLTKILIFRGLDSSII